jgi:hypothetical protein
VSRPNSSIERRFSVGSRGVAGDRGAWRLGWWALSSGNDPAMGGVPGAAPAARAARRNRGAGGADPAEDIVHRFCNQASEVTAIRDPWIVRFVDLGLPHRRQRPRWRRRTPSTSCIATSRPSASSSSATTPNGSRARGEVSAVQVVRRCRRARRAELSAAGGEPAADPVTSVIA